MELEEGECVRNQRELDEAVRQSLTHRKATLFAIQAYLGPLQFEAGPVVHLISE